VAAKTRDSATAKKLAAHREQKRLAVKKYTAQWQQKDLLLIGNEKACCSVAAKRHAAQWQQKDLLLSGSQ
jgi:hypothetical protein